jgi:O-acetyl-ADP-ribose deacetylase (regulator of RNase III)
LQDDRNRDFLSLSQCGIIEQAFAPLARRCFVITYIESDLFTAPTQTLVNTVNTVGVMGKGLAKTFKTIYPEMYAEYKRRCESGDLAIGTLLLYRTSHKWVLNFPTKRHWRQPSRLEDIEAGLRTFQAMYAEQGITDIAFPQLGCGNGGLDWETQVRPLMERYLSCLPIDISIHLPERAPQTMSEEEFERTMTWLRAEPRSRSYASVWVDLETAAAEGRAEGWSVAEIRGSVSLKRALPDPTWIQRDDLFDLWRRLRTFGYLLPGDVAVTGLSPEPILSLFASLPYVEPTRAVPMVQFDEYHGDLTAALLDLPAAQGVRFVSSRVAAEFDVPVSPEPEDADTWDANPTTRQLALFSTS